MLKLKLKYRCLSQNNSPTFLLINLDDMQLFRRIAKPHLDLKKEETHTNTLCSILSGNAWLWFINKNNLCWNSVNKKSCFLYWPLQWIAAYLHFCYLAWFLISCREKWIHMLRSWMVDNSNGRMCKILSLLGIWQILTITGNMKWKSCF